MFALQPSDELAVGTPIISQEDKILDNDPILSHTFFESNIINFSTNSNNKKGQKQSGWQEIKQTGTRNDDRSIRRVMHRDSERKRRQEMSELYASLRSLLPLEHIQGKRSTCDHMLGAVNYLKNLQKIIHELKIRRDRLKNNLLNLSATKDAMSSKASSNLPKFVTVNLVQDGVEILISNSIENSDQFQLSRLLAELLETGLDVISCVSTKIEGRFLHRIQAENSDLASLDLSMLKERLDNLIN